MGSRRRTQRTCSVMQDITNAECFRFTLLCPKISIFNELCLESESNTPAKDPKAIIFRKFIFGDCPKWNQRLCFGISGMCIWSQASLCIHE